MVRIDWASHCGFVQAKTSPCRGGAGTLHSAPDARGSQEEGTVRYRSWLERIRKENPAFLTIVSLELPESPIPLIESQANARWRRGNFNEVISDKDDILDEFLEKVTEAGKEKEKKSRVGKSNLFRRRSQRNNRKNDDGDSSECTKALATFEECTRNIIEGRSRERPSWRDDISDDCICSEIPKDLRVNIHRRTEVMRPPSSPSPEVTHTIRIAMKYGRPSCKGEDDESLEEDEEDGAEEDAEQTATRTKNEGSKKDLQGPPNARREPAKQDARCVTAGVNAALDLTLNCNSVRLTSRDASLRTATTRSER
ncbi:hypothetical protein X777_10121 [Ooceraea biroi]|uniref:Uncharacterized protein n=1 Tax=Ooceraea biroi TaxID=2015173 RepID=A0A026X3A0_OOCBI|nr:hypothetical protein X777_10121 [Ooceraea biroi]